MRYSRWADVKYNFLVGGDGAIYVGRGWDVEGEHTGKYSMAGIGIAFIGTFSFDAPPKKQLEAAQKLIEDGVKMEKLEESYTVYGQRQLIENQNPGQALYEIIQKWKHWRSKAIILIP